MSTILRIAILTTARSDFGLLKRVIQCSSRYFQVDLLIAGSHFLSSRGFTVREIEEEFGAASNVYLTFLKSMVDGNTSIDQVQTIANTQILASRWFACNRCDFLLFLGDRWELWGVTLAAFLHGIPLGHISGGEVTEGVIDDAVRHSHSKISSLHFVATNEYAKNLSSMGEEDWRINVVGECGLDQIHDSEFATSEAIKSRFNVDLDKETFLVTFHPSTLDFETPFERQIEALLDGLKPFVEKQIVFTAPGVDKGSDVILKAIRDFVERYPTARFVGHFGSSNYLAVMRAAKIVIGNSSSGLVEAASLGVPAINVGQRQKNRISADSVQHVAYDVSSISCSISTALTADYQAFARTCSNPYDPFRDGKNSERIVTVLSNALRCLPKSQLLMKRFDTNARPDLWNKLLNRRQ